MAKKKTAGEDASEENGDFKDLDEEEEDFGEEDEQEEPIEEEDEEEDENEEDQGDDEKSSTREPFKLPDERWLVDISLDGEIEQTLRFLDMKALFGIYLGIRKKFFDDFLVEIPKVKHYSAGKGIEKVTGIDGEDWTRNSWLLVMAREMKENSVFWLLIKRESDLSGIVVAIGPEPFAQAIMDLFPGEKNVDVRIENMKKILIWLTVEPARWKSVGVLVPNWL